MFSLFVAWIWTYIEKNKFKKQTDDPSEQNPAIKLMEYILSDSPLDKLLFDSYILEEPLLITLSTNKVYIGVVTELGKPNEKYGMDQDVSIAPIMSGYRDSETLKIEFTTIYTPFEYISIEKPIDVAIRQDRIISVSWFDFDIYEKANKKF